ncbi:sulfotransferase family protein [Rhodoligotrophos ferricapiens]|uniref:sulfotransferase family protein n=1 Tax=Rhodoligotrophos ferricapiens TaxID=3069264 RepID=UPI00315CD818
MSVMPNKASLSLEDIDFLIIGATKSATTWLQKSLQLDPAVAMPDPELHYFSREFGRGDAWYLEQFPKEGAARLLGEKSNSYLESATAAQRIARLLPHVKLIAQLRNPIDRAYSDYCMMFRRGEVTGNIEAYLDPRGPHETRLLRAGLYFEQLKAFYDSYPAGQIHVTLYETVNTDPVGHLAAVRRFLGLGATDTPPLLTQKVKDKTEPVLPPHLRRWLAPVKPVLAPVRNSPLVRTLRNAMASEMRYPELTCRLRDRLAEHYHRDVEALSHLVGRDLSGWLTGPSVPARAAGAMSGKCV